MNKIKIGILIFISVLLTFIVIKYPNTYSNGYYSNCLITKVDDGDTISLKCGKVIINDLRLGGIDTPDFHPGDKKQCFYDESKNFLINNYQNKKVLFNVQILGQDLGKDQDKGYRKVGILYLYSNKNENKLSLQEIITLNGYGFYWLNSNFNFPEDLGNKLKQNVEIARSNKSGLWNICEIIYQNENLFLNDITKQALPPIRTNFVSK